MAKRHPRVIVWSGEEGVAPDGTRYRLNGEIVRGEPRMWWAERMVASGGYRPVESQRTFADGWPTKDRAKQDAEADLRARQARSG